MATGSPLHRFTQYFLKILLVNGILIVFPHGKVLIDAVMITLSNRLLSPGQTITTFGHPVPTCCDMLAAAGSNFEMVKEGDQKRATCCAQLCRVDVLRWHVAIVWPGP